MKFNGVHCPSCDGWFNPSEKAVFRIADIAVFNRIRIRLVWGIFVRCSICNNPTWTRADREFIRRWVVYQQSLAAEEQLRQAEQRKKEMAELLRPNVQRRLALGST